MFNYKKKKRVDENGNFVEAQNEQVQQQNQVINQNFLTKNQVNKLAGKQEDFKNAYNSANTEQQNQIKGILQNTKDQNFSSAEYNEQARKNGEENWQTAYRNDILGVKDQETEIQKKHRLYNEEKARQEAEYQKRIAENPETALPGDTSPQPSTPGHSLLAEANSPSPLGEGVEQNGEQTNQPSPLAPLSKVEGEKGQVDYQNWDVAGWKSRGSSKEELENAVEKKYGTVASWKEDGSLEAVINGEKFSWKIDTNGNPVKTSLGNANQVDINKGQVFQMIQNGNTASEINDYIYKNNLQDDPDVKNGLKQKYISDYEKPILQKYSGLSLQDLHKAVKNGEILPGTEVFNKLPQAQAYMQYQKSFAVIDARKDSDFEAVNSAIEIEKIVEKSIGKFFDTKGIEEITERFKNDEEIKQYRADIYESQKKIVKYKRQMKDIEKNVRARMGGASESTIQAEIAWQAESLLNNIATETALMNASLGMIGDRKGDFEVEMKMLGYKDGLKKEQYMQGLNLYRYERDRMDSFKKMELQFKNQELAFNRQHNAQKEIMELQQKYKGGTYQVGVDGSLNYIVNGKAQKVKFDDGKTLFTTSRQDMTIQTKLNEDGTFSVYSISKDGKNVNIQNYDMEGNLVAGMPNKIADALSKVGVDGKQCAEGVNDYLNQLGIKGRYVPSEWSGKKALINSENPIIGGLAIWNPASVGSKNHQYGHVGIVEGVSQDGKYVYISDWNADGVSEKFVRNRKVPISDIMKTGGFNKPPIKITKESGNFNSVAGDTDLRNSEWRNKYPNEASFKNNNTAGITWNANFENPKPGTNAYILQQNGINFHKGTARPSREGGHYVAFDNVEDGIKAHYLMLKNSPQTVRERLKDWVGIGNIDAYAKEVFAGSGLDISLLDKPLNTLSDSELTPLLKSQIKRESSGMYRYLEQNNWLQNFQAVNTGNSKGKTTSSGGSASYNSSTVDNNSSGYSKQALAYAEDLGKGKIKLSQVPQKIRDEVQEAKIKLEKEGYFLLKEDDEQAINLKSKVDLIESMLEKDGDLNSLAGRWQMDYWFESGKKDMINNIENLLSNDILNTLIKAKENGATFGALSDAELEMLRAASDRLASGAIRDEKTKRITGFNKSEKQLKEDLENFRDKYVRAYKKATGIDLKNVNLNGVTLN